VTCRVCPPTKLIDKPSEGPGIRAHFKPWSSRDKKIPTDRIAVSPSIHEDFQKMSLIMGSYSQMSQVRKNNPISHKWLFLIRIEITNSGYESDEWTLLPPLLGTRIINFAYFKRPFRVFSLDFGTLVSIVSLFGIIRRLSYHFRRRSSRFL